MSFSLKKALKGLYAKKFETTPPKTHNLIFLVEKVNIVLSEDLYDFIFTLNGVSVPTRYPDDLKKMQKDYNKSKTQKALEKSKEALKWLRTGL